MFKFLRFAALYCVLSATSTAVHETGHVVVGRLVGVHATKVEIGYAGPQLFRGTIGGIDVSVHAGAFGFEGGQTTTTRTSFTAWNVLLSPLIMLAGACLAALYLLGLYRLCYRDRMLEPLKAAFLGPACWPLLAAFRSFFRDRRACRDLSMGITPATRKTFWYRFRMFGSALGELDPAALFIWMLFNEGMNLVFIPGRMDGGKAITVMTIISHAYIGRFLTIAVMVVPLVMAFLARRKRLRMEASVETKPDP